MKDRKDFEEWFYSLMSIDESEKDSTLSELAFDGLDFIESTMEFEKQFNVTVDESDKNEYSFGTSKDFIDWLFSFKKQPTGESEQPHIKGKCFQRQKTGVACEMKCDDCLMWDREKR